MRINLVVLPCFYFSSVGGSTSGGGEVFPKLQRSNLANATLYLFGNQGKIQAVAETLQKEEEECLLRCWLAAAAAPTAFIGYLL